MTQETEAAVEAVARAICEVMHGEPITDAQWEAAKSKPDDYITALDWARAAIAAHEATLRPAIEAEIVEWMRDQAGIELSEAAPLYQIGYANALTEAASAIESEFHRQQKGSVDGK